LVKNKECCVLNVQASPATYLALSKVCLSPLVRLQQTRTPDHSNFKHRYAERAITIIQMIATAANTMNTEITHGIFNTHTQRNDLAYKFCVSSPSVWSCRQLPDSSINTTGLKPRR